MNVQNLEYLEDNLLRLGFSRELFPALRKNMEQRFPQFVLIVNKTLEQAEIRASLLFEKMEGTNLYFFTRYDAQLNPERNGLRQAFPVYKGKGASLKEACNLLQGRAVYTHLSCPGEQRRAAWFQLDLQAMGEDGNYKVRRYEGRNSFDLEQVLEHYPISELRNPLQRELLVLSLRKGNCPAVWLERVGGADRMHIIADPRSRSLIVYDALGEQLSLNAIRKKYGKSRQVDRSLDQADAKDGKKEMGQQAKVTVLLQ
ncbi:hypothetical protein V9K67_20725 [Paraflavisolibacter sp. H34]|uniref:hypothetical protein n=1 Tax=Huijunlia imazamoxiresistens TaxID=3127457 RepID=UPI00301A39BF